MTVQQFLFILWGEEKHCQSKVFGQKTLNTITQQGLHKSHRLKLKISTTHQIMAVNTTKKNFGNKNINHETENNARP